MRAFVTCDGEAKQIEVFQMADMLQKFIVALVDFGKTPASCSAICQSSDASVFFKAVKQKLKGIFDLAGGYTNTGLNDRLKTIITPRKFSASIKAKMVDAMQQVVTTIKEVIKPSMIIAGYTDIGQWPLSYDMAMSKCSKVRSGKVTQVQIQTMRDKVPDIVALYRLRGGVTENEYDAMGIVNCNSGNPKPKEQRALHQQRAVIMNNEDCIQKYKAYHSLKDQAILDRASAADQRRNNKAAKDAEAIRISLLSPDALKEERRLKRISNKAAKDARDLAARLAEQPDDNHDDGFEGFFDDEDIELLDL